MQFSMQKKLTGHIYTHPQQKPAQWHVNCYNKSLSEEKQ